MTTVLWPALLAVLLLFVRGGSSQPQATPCSHSRHVGSADRSHPSHGRHVHVPRCANRRSRSGGSLDERTGLDLNLDDVFSAIDRTQSTLGQHALYHRLRTAPLRDHLGAFEALVQRMTIDAPARERAQMALARLQDPHGYDVWWLARAERGRATPWYIVFPILTASAIVLAALAPLWSAAVMPLVALLVLNVRFATQRIPDLGDRPQLQAMRSADCDGRVIAVSHRR